MVMSKKQIRLTKWEVTTTNSALSKYRKTVETKTKQPLKEKVIANITSTQKKLKSTQSQDFPTPDNMHSVTGVVFFVQPSHRATIIDGA